MPDADAGELAAGQRRHREAEGRLLAMMANQPRANCSGSPLSVSASLMPAEAMPAMVAPIAATTTPIRNVISEPDRDHDRDGREGGERCIGSGSRPGRPRS